jgi:hypothetical protein
MINPILLVAGIGLIILIANEPPSQKIISHKTPELPVEMPIIPKIAIPGRLSSAEPDEPYFHIQPPVKNIGRFKFI